jgi:hypothetical protein
MLATLVLGLSATILHAPAAALGKGPRTEALTITYYRNITWAYLALKSGEIDAVGYELPKELYYDAVADPNLVLAPVDDFGMYEFDLNNNATIASARGYRSPMNYVALRRATALLTDKNYIVDTICGGHAARIDAAVAAPIKAWANQSYWTPHYPWEYNPAQAASVLDTTFPKGPTPNPYYHSSFPGSAAYLRTYPAGHAKAGQDLDPLIVCVRTDDPRRLAAGRLVYGNMRKHGIPVTAIEGPHAALYDRVEGDMDYHLYTGGWSLTYWPVCIYSLYHSDWYYPYGANRVTGFEHPQLDAYLELARFPANASEARRGVQLVTGYMTEQCVVIPLFSSRAFWAWRTDLLGVVNMHGYGPESPNDYAFLNAYKPDGSAIRYGLKTAPVALNIIYSQWYYDYQNLNRMNLYSGLDTSPYDLSLDQPSFATTRVVGTWDDGGTPKTRITYTYRPDAYFVEPVTGTPLEHVNASHVYASIWYHYQLGDGWFYPNVEDVHHLNLTGPYTLDIYSDWNWYWFILYVQPPILSFHLLQQPPLSAYHSETFPAATADAFLGLTHPVYWVDRLYDDAGPLTRGSDWELYSTGTYVADVYIHAGVNISGTVHVDYWSAEDADGYTPGNLPWETALEGAGAWYATGHTPGVGGNLTLHKNLYYYVETPLLGEIDCVRKPNGGFKIDIYDVVLAAGAYGSQGIGVPDAHWLPGADVAPPGGVIDIYDIVTITGKYGQAFDLPP